MPQIYSEARMMKSVYDKLMRKVQGKVPAEPSERLIHVWRFGEKTPHAGQIYSKKILPNGNIQTRITTASGCDSTIATDTRVYSPSGELLKSYFGIRGPKCTVTDADGKLLKEYEPTRVYANNLNDVYKAIRNEQSMNPGFKSLGFS